MFSERLTRLKVLIFFAAQPNWTVALKTFCGAYHWARTLMGLGHTIHPISPADFTEANSLIAAASSTSAASDECLTGPAVALDGPAMRYFER